MAKGLALFEQGAVGITKQISPWDTMVYSTVNPGLLYALVYMMWMPFLFPGAHMGWAIGCVALMFFIAGLYWLLSCAMPRQGGEYIYISRILHPAIGLMSSFMISFTAISWTGVCADWAIKYAIVEYFVALGVLNGNEHYFEIAAAINQPVVRAIIGSLMILFIWIVFYKGSKWMMKMSWLALGGTLIGAIAYITANITSDPAAFAANFTQLSGLDYNSVVQLAQEAGHPTTFLVKATIMAGSTYIVLNTLGATFGANLAGEVRSVQKSQLLALFGSLGILMTVWAIFYGLTYTNFGAMWYNSLLYLCGTGHAAYPWGGYEPFVTILIGIMTKSPLFIFLMALAFFTATYGSCAGMSFGPARNIYAWGFDRIIPEKAAEINEKTQSPVIASTIALIAAWIFLLMDCFAPDWTAFIGYTMFTWFIAWIFLGIAGMLFPYRRKLLFESAPPVVRTKFLGLPVVVWLGFMTTAFSVFICWSLLEPLFRGAMPMTMIYMSAILAALPLCIYYISKSNYAKKGIDIDIQFMEIPAD